MADLPVVAEWIDDAAEAPAVVVLNGHDKFGAHSHRVSDEGIRIGHLDNGLDARHPASPMNLERGQGLANAVGLFEYWQKKSRGENPAKPIPPAPTTMTSVFCVMVTV